MRASNVFSFVALLTLLSAQGCSLLNHHRATTKMTQHINHVAAMPVIVESRNGSVEITADKSATDVHIDARLACTGETQTEAELRLAHASLSATRDASQSLVIKPVFPGGARDNDGADLTIRLPDASAVNIKTSNGWVSLKNVAGTMSIVTSNAAVMVTDCVGTTDVVTSNGDVDILRLAGAITIRTSNGSVDAKGVAGPADIHTSNGAITLALESAQSGSVQLKTSNASIKARVSSAFAGTVRLETSNASIDLKDPAGRIKSSELHDNSGRLTIGESERESSLETSNGRIEFAIDD